MSVNNKQVLVNQIIWMRISFGIGIAITLLLPFPISLVTIIGVFILLNLSLMKGNWGGVGTAPVQCPSWAILSLDHMGRIKQPCCIGSADSKGLKPICEECGLGCYSILVAQGITGN
jgi:hypothetical protein